MTRIDDAPIPDAILTDDDLTSFEREEVESWRTYRHSKGVETFRPMLQSRPSSLDRYDYALIVACLLLMVALVIA